jgi:glycosyltransferase involved in cell wall biosynthesis
MQIGTMYHSPIKLYEYMAMAKPLLASDFADARQLIDGRDTGFLFAADQPDSLKAALRRVHADRHRLPLMGRAARALVAAEHTWQARAEAMIESLDSLLAAPSPAPATGTTVPTVRELAAP